MSWGDLDLYMLLHFRVSSACEVQKIVPWACYWNSLSHATILRIHVEVPMTRSFPRHLGAASALSPSYCPVPSLFSSQECWYASLCYPAKYYIDSWRIICLLACLYVLVSMQTTWNSLDRSGFVVHRVAMGEIFSPVVWFAPVEYLSTSSPYSFIHRAHTLYIISGIDSVIK
jgi:hypothetical protein